MRRRTVHTFLTLFAAVAVAVAGGACAPKAKPTTAPASPATAAAAPTPATPVPAARPAPPSADVPAAAAAPPAAAAKPNPGPPPLTGVITRAVIESFNDTWKGLRAQDYEPDGTAVSTIRDNVKDVEVFAVVATWCPDTRRDLPRFFKIADQSGLPMGRVRLLAVDRTKKDADGQTEKWKVTRVPTFIFLRGGQEIGRVTEKPATTLEKDIAEIVSRR